MDSADERKGEALERRYVGVDGGGTNTVCLLGDEQGRVLAVSRGEGGNFKSRPLPDVLRSLQTLIDDVLQRTGTKRERLAGLFLGLAGSDRPDDKRRIEEALRPGLPASTRLTVHNDAVTALAAGTWGKRGIVLISGTGSIAYGYDPETGRTVRTGGWGYLLGDEGSGFELGRLALTAVMRAYDGRGPATLLTGLVLEWAGLTQQEQLINFIYERPNFRADIASASRLVLQAAAAADPVAEELVEGALRELALLVRTAAEEMGGEGGAEPVPVVLSGGLFSNREFERKLRESGAVPQGTYDIRMLALPPVVGAYLLALREAGIPLTDRLRQRIEMHFQQEGGACP